MGERYSAFFYGTLLHPSILKRVIGHTGEKLELCPALLLDHTRHKIKHADYPGVIPFSKSRELFTRDLSPEEHTVRGTLVQGLSKEDIRLLDVFEGNEYTRETVQVHALGPFAPLGSPSALAAVPTTPPPVPPLDQLPAARAAQTYIWASPISDLTPELWDYADFIRDNAWKWVGSSSQDNKDYAEVDKRREMNGDIVRTVIVSNPDDGEDRAVAVES